MVAISPEPKFHVGTYNNGQPYQPASGRYAALFMNRPALFTTLTCESSCRYLPQNTAQISRHALASGLRDDSGDRG